MIDMYSEEVRQNPYPAYEYIRSKGRAVYDPNSNVWFVGHYDDVLRALKDSNTFSNREASAENTLLGNDGLMHMEVRKKLNPAFSSSVLEGIHDAIEAKAVEVVSNIVRQGEAEVIHNLAAIVPLSVFSWMFGVPLENIHTFKKWSDAIISSGKSRIVSPTRNPWLSRLKRHLRGQKLDNDLESVRECEIWLRKLLNLASIKPSSGWVSTLLISHLHEGLLSMEEIIDISILLVVAATETTTSTIGVAILHLANNTTLQDQIRSNPEILDSFIEEVLRFDGPIQRRIRYVVETTSIGGIELKTGDRLILLIGSANRDSSQFSEPDVFKIDRKPNKHLTFGAGAHFCIGAQLARIEVRAVLNAILANTSKFSLVNQFQPIKHPMYISLRGPQMLNVKFCQ